MTNKFVAYPPTVIGSDGVPRIVPPVHDEPLSESENLLEQYSLALDNMAWYGQGNLVDIARLAKKLGRSYTVDIAERKAQLLNAQR